MDRGAWQAAIHRVPKSRTQLKQLSMHSDSYRASQVALVVKNPPSSWEDTLEEGMASHSSVLAWRIPWTEEPGGL